ncbi:F-box/kelch-repeat protein SKIP6 [Ananas comosus]|uniref:F-box/kelch-repeat protein SKIP6 n=1 Tax=Ananas comosus TaxID=4615 RepID=A0A199VV63_ANACO|nr:F-box/kelch-repeat protein SKIP6 [Ananas comosus]
MGDAALIPGLPDDVAVRCIARAPRSSHPEFCRVSRSWRSLLRSPLLFSVRSALGAAEPVLCLNLRSPTDQSRWLLLHRGRRNPSPLPAPPLPSLGSAAAALGPFLFVLGGSLAGVPSAAVQVLDARLPRWSLGPCMSAPREFAAAAALGGRIYAVGGCVPISEAWAESLDPSASSAAAAWVVVRVRRTSGEVMHGAPCSRAALAVRIARGGVRPGGGAAVGGGGAGARSGVEGEGGGGHIKGYDPELDEWKRVEGVERELPKFLCGATLSNLGGMLCVVWEGKEKGDRRKKEMVIDWAGIEVSRTSDGGLKGSVLWVESIELAVPRGLKSLIDRRLHCIDHKLRLSSNSRPLLLWLISRIPDPCHQPRELLHHKRFLGKLGCDNMLAWQRLPSGHELGETRIRCKGKLRGFFLIRNDKVIDMKRTSRSDNR